MAPRPWVRNATRAIRGGKFSGRNRTPAASGFAARGRQSFAFAPVFWGIAPYDSPQNFSGGGPRRPLGPLKISSRSDPPKFPHAGRHFLPNPCLHARANARAHVRRQYLRKRSHTDSLRSWWTLLHTWRGRSRRGGSLPRRTWQRTYLRG